MTPKQFKNTLRDLDQDISNCQLNFKHCSDEKLRKDYEKLLKDYQKQRDEFVKKYKPKIKKVKVEYWKPESKGEIDDADFDRPYLTVSVQKAFLIERPPEDSICKLWSVKNDRCQYLVEEKVSVVGVI